MENQHHRSSSHRFADAVWPELASPGLLAAPSRTARCALTTGFLGLLLLLAVIEGDLSGGGGVDKFRLKIWEKLTGRIIYDNEPGRSDAADPITPVGAASSIIITK